MSDHAIKQHPKGKQRLTIGLCLFTLLQAWQTGAQAASDLQEVRIGVRAHRGAEAALKRWAPTAAHLTAQIPGYRFMFIPYETVGSQNEAASRGEFDFVLSSPSSYVEYELRYGARHLATLAKGRDGNSYTQFGSVIFTRSDRDDINSLDDLKGKSIMGVSELGFGGWRVAWYEMRGMGIDPYQDFAAVKYAGGLQPNVVHAVLRGDADSGTVRTGMLESMAAKGQLKMADIKVLNRKASKGFPFAHSTRLYPEWPFARLPHTEDALVQRVTRVLLNMTDDMPAARAGDYVGWHTPHDYGPVHALLRDLAVGPYTGQGNITLKQLITLYGQWMLLGIVVLLLLTGMMLRMHMLNKRLRATEQQLQEMAMHDGLTGLANRHQLDMVLHKEWQHAARHQRSLTAMMIDIDHFKQYNDHYGHVAGDECLRQVALAIQNLFRRANDLVVRYGGEEFLVILLDTDIIEARHHAQELQDAVAQLAIAHNRSPVDRHVTISIGVTSCIPVARTSPERLIQVADQALYTAKENGRNQLACISCESTDTDTQAPSTAA